MGHSRIAWSRHPVLVRGYAPTTSAGLRLSTSGRSYRTRRRCAAGCTIDGIDGIDGIDRIDPIGIGPIRDRDARRGAYRAGRRRASLAAVSSVVGRLGMEFTFSADQRAIADLAENLFSAYGSDEHVRALADAGQTVDRPLWHKLAETGLLGLTLPEGRGGCDAWCCVPARARAAITIHWRPNRCARHRTPQCSYRETKRSRLGFERKAHHSAAR